MPCKKHSCKDKKRKTDLPDCVCLVLFGLFLAGPSETWIQSTVLPDFVFRGFVVQLMLCLRCWAGATAKGGFRGEMLGGLAERFIKR